MGRGRGGRAEEPPWLERERLYETSKGESRYEVDTELDCRQRRAGHRFHYRRRPRSRTRPKHDRTDHSTHRTSALGWIALLPIASALCCFIMLASDSAIYPMTRNVVAESVNPLIIKPSLLTDGASRRGTSAIILEAAGSGDAPNATSLGRSSIGAGMHIVPRTSASTKIYTSSHRMQHQEQPTSRDSHQQLYPLATETPIIASSQLHTRLHPTLAHASLRPQRTCICPYIFTPSPPATHLSPPTAHQLQPAPPITYSRSLARPDRTDSSRLPAHLRPAIPPACRPNCPGRLARTRPLPGRSAQRLHAVKPCHPVSHGTLHTLQEYRKEKSEKKRPIFRCNNVFQEPDGGTCAQHTRHQLWTRANPAYVFVVPQPLAPHNHRSLRAGTRAASTRPLTPAHTLLHGRLQRTDGPSSMDHGRHGQSLAPPSPPSTQAAASLATPGLQPTWGAPATLLADLVGAWLITHAQRQCDRHRTHSTLAVQFMGTPTSAASQTPGLGPGGGDDGEVRTHNFFLAISLSSLAGEQHMDTLVLAADQTPGLGSGEGDAVPVRTHLALQLPGTRRFSQPSHRNSIRAAGLYCSVREQCRDTPTLAADQTPGLGPGGGATDHAGTHSVLQPPRARCSSRPSLHDAISAVSLSFSARGKYMDAPTLAVDQTPGLGPGGGDTRQVTAAVTGSMSTMVTIPLSSCSSSDPAPIDEHSGMLDSTVPHA